MTTMTAPVEVFLLLVLILGFTTVANKYRCFCFNALEREEYTSLGWGFFEIILIKRQVQE